MEITRIEGRFKVSQERRTNDWSGVMKRLEQLQTMQAKEMAMFVKKGRVIARLDLNEPRPMAMAQSGFYPGNFPKCQKTPRLIQCLSTPVPATWSAVLQDLGRIAKCRGGPDRSEPRVLSSCTSLPRIQNSSGCWDYRSTPPALGRRSFHLWPFQRPDWEVNQDRYSPGRE